MPNTLTELAIAYSVVWVLLCLLIIKIKSDVTKLEARLGKLDVKNASKS
jgi:hypothetical protein